MLPAFRPALAEMVKLLTELAPAKINLFLRVVGRRPDGSHELDSLFVPISLYDGLQIELRAGGPASVTLRYFGAAVAFHVLAWLALLASAGDLLRFAAYGGLGPPPAAPGGRSAPNIC